MGTEMNRCKIDNLTSGGGDWAGPIVDKRRAIEEGGDQLVIAGPGSGDYGGAV